MMAKPIPYRISGTVKSQVGEQRFSLTVKSPKSIGAAAEQFERDNPDCTIDSIEDERRLYW